MEEDQSSDSDGSYCPVEDKPKPAESSSHLSPPEAEATGVSALDAGKAQSDRSCVTPGATQELINTSTSPPVSEEADQQTEKEKAGHKKKGQKSKSTGAQTALDQNANMDQNANIKSSQRETDRQDEEQSSQQKNTGSEKHTDSGEAETSKAEQEPVKTKKYVKTFVF